MDGGSTTRRVLVLPGHPAAPGALQVDDAVLLDATAAVASAEDPGEVAAAVLRPLLRLPGVRAGLVARSPRPGADPVVLAADGYDCTTMAAGAVLPLDAGLPVTEAVRSGASQVVGTGPSWVAVPAGRGAALLLSLTVPPPSLEGVALLLRLGGVVAGALHRAERGRARAADLLVLEEGLSAPRPGTSGLVVRSRPLRPPLTGDVVELVEDGPVRWLLVADVSGHGHAAAVGADRLRAAFVACAADQPGPSAVLSRLDRVLPGGEEDFATALVVRVEDDRVVLASAGHPAPLLAPGGRVPLLPAEPLGLRLPGPWTPAADVGLRLPAGALLLAATDGLVDRRAEVDLDAVVQGLPPGRTAVEVADAVWTACDDGGPGRDDASLAVLALGGQPGQPTGPKGQPTGPKG